MASEPILTTHKDDKMAYGSDVGLELSAGRLLLERESCKGDSESPFHILAKNRVGY